MSEDKNPREFTYHGDGERIQCIERAAYDKLAAELTASNARFADLAAAANLANAKLAAAEKERDAYKRAKAENDERFQLERDQARAECERLRALGSEYVQGVKGCHDCLDGSDLEAAFIKALEGKNA